MSEEVQVGDRFTWLGRGMFNEKTLVILSLPHGNARGTCYWEGMPGVKTTYWHNGMALHDKTMWRKEPSLEDQDLEYYGQRE